MEIKVSQAALRQLSLCKRMCMILLVISTLLLISACEPSKDLSTSVNDSEKEHSRPAQDTSSLISTLKIPLSTNEKIEAVYGWLDSSTILYGVEKGESEPLQLMTWNLNKNETSIFYQPTASFSEVSISPSGKNVLVSSFTASGKASIAILDQEGEPEFSVEIPAYDLAFEWNSFEEGSLFLTGFYKDWTYTSYLVNSSKQTLAPLEFPQPFAQWDSQEGLIYLDWNRDEPALTAPLLKKSLNDDYQTSLVLDVIHFKRMKHTLMTIQADTENKDRGTYTFYDDTNKPVHSFSVPLLKSFSDWVIPAYDIVEKNQELLTFVPSESKEADQYQGGFTLTKFNWEMGTQEVLMKDMENEPISCSFDGSLCLYGHQFEKIIDMKTEQIKKLF